PGLQVIRALRMAVVGFRAHRGMFLASGLAFNLLICLIPILFFLVSVVGFVLNQGSAAEVVLNQFGQVVPVYRSELHQVLAQIIRRRSLSGLLGTLSLLLFATQLFASLRMVLNLVFSFTHGRNLVLDTLKDLLLLFVMGILFLASVLVTD